MATRTLVYSTLTAADPYTIGGAPDNLVDYALGGAGTVRITLLSGANQYSLQSGTQSNWYDDTALTGNVISAYVKLGTTNGSSCGPALVNKTTGNGFVALTSDGAGNIRMFLISSWALGSQVGSAITQTHADNQTRGLTLNKTTNIATVTVDGVPSATTFDMTAYSGYNVDRAAAVSRGGRLRELISEYTPAQTLDTLTDPLVAGAAFSGTSTGFTDGAATLSSNGLSVDVTVASGACSGTWPIAVDAQPYPTLPKSAQTITLTQGADTATIASDLEQPAGDDIVNFVSPITNDDTYPTYYIEQDGFTADGGQFVFTPYSDLVIAADGEITVTGAGVLVGYFIPATGTGAGNAYYYTFNVIDGAVVSGGRGLSVRGLSVRGLSVVGLSVRGLGGAAAMAGGFPYILPFVLS